MEYEIGTPVLRLAAAYLALGKKYIRADKTNPKMVKFYFTHPDVLDGVNIEFATIEERFVNKSLLVNEHLYNEALNTLRSIIHTN